MGKTFSIFFPGVPTYGTFLAAEADGRGWEVAAAAAREG